MRRLMLLLALLAAMLLVVGAPALAAQDGSKYWKNYYPNSYYNYCHWASNNYYGDTNAEKWCSKYYTDYKTKWSKGKKYYYVHVYYEWKDPNGKWYTKDYWYYCRYIKYDDPNSTKPHFHAWVGYKPTGDYYWESYYKGPLNF